jgi:glycosyltransferase involved in cell wall biosynthesis
VRILFLTTVLPAGRSTGGEAVTQAFVDALRTAGHDVTTIGYRRPGTRGAPAAGEVPAGERPIETSDAGPYAAAWLLRAMATRRPYSTVKYVSRGYRRAVAAALTPPPAVVLVDHAQSAWAASGLRGVRRAYVAHNVEHEHYAELAAAGPGPRERLYTREARLMRRLEEELCRTSAAVWTLTAADAASLERLGGPAPRVFTVPAAAVADPPAAATCDVALLGSWTWDANQAALRWFADAVLPLLGGLRVRVAGAGAEEAVGARPGLELCGRVPDATAFLQDARVVAVPAVTGSGIQVKTLDAIASGRPVVASPVALRGIDDPPGSVTVTGDAEHFAAALRAAASAARARNGIPAGIAWARERRARFAEEVRAAAEELAA